MCRPIESRDSLGTMGPAAALFAGYQPPGKSIKTTGPSTTTTKPFRPNIGPSQQQQPGSPWLVGAIDSTLSPLLPMMTGFDPMTNVASSPSLPFVSMPKTMNAMPWMNATGAENLPFGTNDDQLFLDEIKPMTPLAETIGLSTTPRNSNSVDVADLGDMLDLSVPDEFENLEKDKEDLLTLNLDDGFDGTEMSILYSFLVDTPEEPIVEKKSNDLTVDDGILNLNMLASNPLETLMESLEEDFTDEELKLTPPPPLLSSEPVQVKITPEVKSRRLCRAEGCYKRSRSNGLCISHGGGRRCSVDGCNKSSQGGNLCIRHGGGKRCSYEGCDKAAQSNFLCKAHGGGPRCQVPGCSRSSQGGGFCRSHGGGKRCMFDGCTKGTQRGDYCALHGGSRLCEVPGCMRNDRGGGLCATHGGGKRCSMDGCNKPCRRKGLCSAHLRQAEHVTT